MAKKKDQQPEQANPSDQPKTVDSPNPLARALSGSESGCPIPSAHDKLNEAHYFLHEMIDNYHECDKFRYSLSAFLQAARNVTFHLQSDAKHRDGFDDWYKPLQDGMRADTDLALLNSERVRVVHQSALVPASAMFFGAFENGRYKSGFSGLPMNPMQDSVPALIEGRMLFDRGIGGSSFLFDPHRSCDCEEYGLTRTWSLPELPKDTDLVEFANRCLAAVAEVVSAAHTWCGATHNPVVTCDHASGDFRTLRESMIFPEVMKAWNEDPTERLQPKGKSLALRELPFDDAKVLYTLPTGKNARGWASDRVSPFWPKKYGSMLLYSVSGKRVRLSNAVFFDWEQAAVERFKPKGRR